MEKKNKKIKWENKKNKNFWTDELGLRALALLQFVFFVFLLFFIFSVFFYFLFCFFVGLQYFFRC